MENGNIINGYEVYLICEQQVMGLALARKEEDNSTSYAVFNYFKDGKTNWWHYFDDIEKAEMDFFERMPLMLSKYDIYENVKDERLKEIAEDKIANYVYKTTDVNYEQVRNLQNLFDVDEVMRYYKAYYDWTVAIETYMLEHDIDL